MRPPTTTNTTITSRMMAQKGATITNAKITNAKITNATITTRMMAQKGAAITNAQLLVQSLGTYPR
jgi:hypothetical protein